MKDDDKIKVVVVKVSKNGYAFQKEGTDETVGAERSRGEMKRLVLKLLYGPKAEKLLDMADAEYVEKQAMTSQGGAEEPGYDISLDGSEASGVADEKLDFVADELSETDTGKKP